MIRRVAFLYRIPLRWRFFGGIGFSYCVGSTVNFLARGHWGLS